VLLRQFENPANPRCHAETTAEEIWNDTGGKLDVFLAGIGTGGTITGVGRVLKSRLPDILVVGVEPNGAAVLAGQPAVGHHIQGIGAGFVPKILDRSVVDRVVAVDEDEAVDAARRLARLDGILAGASSGAALAAALRLAKEPAFRGKRCVMVLPDTGERYVSTPLFERVAS
jgi:cysteine synthase A